MKTLTWLKYSIDFVLRKKLRIKKSNKHYSKRTWKISVEAAREIKRLLETDKPFAVGRMGLFETAVMRMYEFEKKKKYSLVMNNIYNCAGFFPNDISLGDEFLRIYKESLLCMDILACNKQLCENYFIDNYTEDDCITTAFKVFEICVLGKDSWTSALKGKKVLVVTPFTESVEKQYKNRDKLFEGTDILPEFELKTYKSLLTVGDMKDERFKTWFDALSFMEKEIMDIDFDVALLGCGAYGFPLAAAIKKSGRQAIHMGGILQILFGIMGKRWDGTADGGEANIRTDVAKYYNEFWTYPIEGRPKEADKVEYGPYWK